MVTKRKKILFLAEGITMAHFTRAAALAQSLDPAEWEVHFRTPERYHQFLRTDIARKDLPTLDPDEFARRLARGKVLYDHKTIRGYVEHELEIFQEIKPDLVVGDYRLSLCISCPLVGVPFASIYNAYWSPYRKQPAIVPEHPLTSWFSHRILNPLYALIRPFFYAHHARQLNRVLKDFGLPRIPNDIRNFLMAGDLVLYPDIPEMIPLEHVPSHHHFIGPCLWSLETPKPSWWEEAFQGPEPKVLVALGSSGSIKLIPAILQALADLPVKVILATSGRSVGKIDPTVYATNLLPYAETAGRCALVVSHGGSSSVYPALSAGAPVLAVPSNLDAHLSAAVLEESGAGISVRSELASADRLQSLVAKMLADAKYKKAAVRWSAVLSRYDSGKIFPDLLRRFFASR